MSSEMMTATKESAIQSEAPGRAQLRQRQAAERPGR